MNNKYVKLNFLLIMASLIEITQSLNNGLGLTPPMGWNSWNKWGCNI